MKAILLSAVVSGLFLSSYAAETVNFDGAKPGELPPDWVATQTGKGKAKWHISKDHTAPSQPNVLEQAGEAAFPVCVRKGVRLKNGFVEVKFNAVAGKKDQAGGVVWRYRDADNYYVCRANALEDNVVLYKMENGKRKALDIVGRKGGYGVKQPVASGKWHTLRVDFVGSRFTVRFGGQQLFQVEDGTFTDAGAVGVWTKSDSVTLFDDFSYGTK